MIERETVRTGQLQDQQVGHVRARVYESTQGMQHSAQGGVHCVKNLPVASRLAAALLD